VTVSNQIYRVPKQNHVAPCFAWDRMVNTLPAKSPTAWIFIPARSHTDAITQQSPVKTTSAAPRYPRSPNRSHWRVALIADYCVIAAHDNGHHHQIPREPTARPACSQQSTFIGADGLPPPHLHRTARQHTDPVRCRSEVEPVIGYWSRTFIGWVAYHEDIR
jgi:hypothetical protein